MSELRQIQIAFDKPCFHAPNFVTIENRESQVKPGEFFDAFGGAPEETVLASYKGKAVCIAARVYDLQTCSIP